MILLYTTIFLFSLYALLVLYYAWGWSAVPIFTSTNQSTLFGITVIIPARNEEENLPTLLAALQQQKYPAEFIEIIVVDDHSTDNTATIAASFPGVKVIQLTDDNINSYKKKAIDTGIAAAQFSFIVTTDADCVPRKTWLQTIASFKEATNSVLIAAPVCISCNSSVLQIFQSMDFMVLQGITGAVVHRKQLSMCNGANLGYDRDVFYEVNGFEGIDSIASGDDMLLMHKIRKRYPDRVNYLKSTKAIVYTDPMLTWKSFFHQRVRWASKAGKYDDKGFLPVLLLVYLLNLSFIPMIICAFMYPGWWVYTVALWIAKTLVELPLFISVAQFFSKRWIIPLFIFFQPLHVAYTIVSGLFGQFGKYEWKGRRVR